ncbi:MAG: hypothetical protein ACTSVI_00085 [Promethearchaeota archaeon]
MSKMSTKSIRFLTGFIIISVFLLVPMLNFSLDPKINKLNESSFPKRVCAFYYPWYGNTSIYPGESPSTYASLLHWNENNHDPISDPNDLGAAHHPTLGTKDIVIYDSADPKAIRYHLDLAEYSGIDTFISSWWGPYSTTDYNFRILLNETENGNYNMLQTIYFETVRDIFNSTNPNGVTNLYNYLKYALINYGNHSKFLKIHDDELEKDRPVIFVYSATALPSIENWTTVVKMLHEDGYYPFLIADLGTPKAIPEGYGAVFDGFHVYNPVNLYKKEPWTVTTKFEQMVLSSRLNDKLSCATALPGYDDSQLDRVPLVLPRDNGSIYKKSWEIASKVNPDWVLICSFNEWHEGSEIEPSLENGTYYINMTREYISQFKS